MNAGRPDDTPPALPRDVLTAWDLVAASVRPLGSGLINRTFLAANATGEARVIQQVNPVFPPEVNQDIDRVTRHLQDSGLETPRLVPTADGALCIPAEDGAWRALTFIRGRSLNALERPRQAMAAGRLLGAFHRALAGYDHAFASRRPPVHELGRHLAALEEAMDVHADHRDFDRIAPVAESVFEAARGLSPLPVTPLRVVHGDPKINNVVFNETADRALCLVDLDTLGRMGLPLELGDALRSWCNPAGEDQSAPVFSREMFAAALAGYGRPTRGWITAQEVGAVVVATATIQVELAARFCADALNERYFGWDRQRFSSRSEHNRVRASGQLALYRSLVLQRRDLESEVTAAFP